MKNLFLIVFLFLLTTGCGSFTKSSSDPDPTPVAATTKWLFGNSLLAWNDQGIMRDLISLGDTGWQSRAFVGATVSQVTDEYETVLNQGHTVTEAVLDGGANDLFLATSVCYDINNDYPYGQISPQCQHVLTVAIHNIGHIIDQMKGSGTTRKIVVIGPYYLRGLAEGYNAAADFAMPLFQSICYDSYTTECSVIDPRQVFLAGGSDYYWLDGIHPSLIGSQILASMIESQLRR